MAICTASTVISTEYGPDSGLGALLPIFWLTEERILNNALCSFLRLIAISPLLLLMAFKFR